MSIGIDQLRERLTLLLLHSQAGEDGREIRTASIIGDAWAKITVHPRISSLVSEETMNVRLSSQTVYHVVIRARPSFSPPSVIRAVQWKGRIFEIIEPFAEYPNIPHFWQALCREDGNKTPIFFKNEDLSDKTRARPCQREQNKDNMKYTKDDSVKANSKQKVNVKPEKSTETLGETEERRETVQGPKQHNRKGDENDHAEN